MDVRGTVLLIAGMRDSGCRQAVTDALERVAGVTDVDVNLYRARATIHHGVGVTPSDLVRAVSRVGYVVCVEEPSGEPRRRRKGSPWRRF